MTTNFPLSITYILHPNHFWKSFQLDSQKDFHEPIKLYCKGEPYLLRFANFRYKKINFIRTHIVYTNQKCASDSSNILKDLKFGKSFQGNWKSSSFYLFFPNLLICTIFIKRVVLVQMLASRIAESLCKINMICVCVSLSVTKDLANCWTDIVLFTM